MRILPVDGSACIGIIIFEQDIVSAAFYEGGGTDNGQLRLVLKLWDRERTAIAHGALHLRERDLNVVLERASIGHIRVDAFFEVHALLVATKVIALPVACAR